MNRGIQKSIQDIVTDYLPCQMVFTQIIQHKNVEKITQNGKKNS